MFTNQIYLLNFCILLEKHYIVIIKNKTKFELFRYKFMCVFNQF